jgi:hypothetical protein
MPPSSPRLQIERTSTEAMDPGQLQQLAEAKAVARQLAAEASASAGNAMLDELFLFSSVWGQCVWEGQPCLGGMFYS